MYKVIASDLDETLLDDQHQICQLNKDKIHQASRLGVKFVPCTGRGYMGIQDILKDLDLHDKEGEYSISFNGCALTENKDNKIIFFNGIDFDKVVELFEFGKTKDVCIHIYTDKKLYAYHLNEDEKNRLIRINYPAIEIGESIEFLRNEKIAKVIYQNINVEYLKSFEQEMSIITDQAVSISYSSNRYMELNKLGVNKGDTMLKLAEILGYEDSQCVAVGDNYNDQSMLEVAGLSVAAKNAVEDIKAICDYVSIHDNNEGVIGDVVDKFILS